RLNPVTECICNVPTELSDVSPDYQVGRMTVLFIRSWRCHRLYPEYIHRPIGRLGQAYNLRILPLPLISCHLPTKRQFHMLSLQSSQTHACARDADEAAQYLTAQKQSEQYPMSICEHVDKTPGMLLRTGLTSIPRLTRTHFGTFHASASSTHHLPCVYLPPSPALFFL
ncbi:hypothetical protein EDB86DRAFT_2806466, partial [Lactarius hatsudake]